MILKESLAIKCLNNGKFWIYVNDIALGKFSSFEPEHFERCIEKYGDRIVKTVLIEPKIKQITFWIEDI